MIIGSRKRMGGLLLTLALLLGMITGQGADAMAADNGLYVKKIKNLPKNFILGMDVSSVTVLGKSGVVYWDAEGRALESLQVFRLLREGNEVPITTGILR